MVAITNNETLRVSDLLDQINLYKFNPSNIQRIVLQHLRDVTDGNIDIVDPTNPFVFLLESSAISTAAAMMTNETNTRRQYPAAAQTAEDIYIHMSDMDFIDRFATPAITKFSFMMDLNDLISKMVIESSTNSKKITIPRNTEFVVADTTFSLQYPIDVRQLSHGGLQIVYDTDETSPLQSLQSNIIDYSIRTDSEGTEWLYFEFDVYQMSVNSITMPLSTSTNFNQNFDITHSFYYARVYFQSTANPNVWNEIYTTHTDQVYDNTKATAVLKVTDKNINVNIPQIYLNSGLIQGTLRIDIYETKGELKMVMSNYPISAFTTKLRAIDKFKDSTPYSSIVSTINYIAYCTKTIVGGTSELGFESLRTKIINNSIGTHNLPITNIQIESSLEKQGYQIVKNIDIVTNRVFLATKALPTPFDEKLVTAGSASIETLIISMANAILLEGVRDNGLRITFTPDVIYKNNSGIINVFPKSQLDTLLNLPVDNIAENVTSSNYLYTPFHYVLDNTSEEFEVRPYYLDSPLIDALRFISQNDTTGYQVNTQSYNIERIINGYKLSIVTKSNKDFIELDDNNVFVQLSYIPTNEQARAYINGVLTNKTQDGERLYTFDITTNFDIDNKDNIILDSFFMFTEDYKETGSQLNNSFDILYSTNNGMPNTWVTDNSDKLIGKFLLPDNTVGITNENIRIVFGYSLKTLWARSRSVVSSAPYLRHTVDIPWLYEKDVYETDPVTGATLTIDAEGNVSYNIIHAVGDPVLKEDGSALIRYQVGDIVLDSDGKPISSDTLSIVRQLDMMFIEGTYYFATDSSSSKYRTDMTNTIVGWLKDDLTRMTGTLLEQTRLYFYPKKSMGQISVMIDSGQIITIEAGQYFNVQMFVPTVTYNNSNLRDALVRNTIKTIDNMLKAATISISAITSELRVNYGSDVVSVKLTGLGGTRNLETLTVMNDSDRCSIRKRLSKLPDGKLIVTEDVTCEFIQVY